MEPYVDFGSTSPDTNVTLPVSKSIPIKPTVAVCQLFAFLLILLHGKPICKFPRKIGFTKKPLGLNQGFGSG